MDALSARIWRQAEKFEAFNEAVTRLAAAADKPDLSAFLDLRLEGLGLSGEQERAEFWQAADAPTPDPFDFRQMGLACEIIEGILKKQGKILIFGDYDCDGLTATALLYLFFKSFDIELTYLIPDRLDDGYGMKEAMAEKIIEEDPDLVITVDCGILNHTTVDLIMQAGIPVIITDHHQPGDDLPRAVAVINPQVAEETYPFKYLSGVGVALKLVQALISHLAISHFPLQRFYCLAGLGTVADAMPLLGENRTIVARAIQYFADYAPPGLRAIADKLRPNSLIDAGFLGFSLGPRLNAAGRMCELVPAMQVLTTTEEKDYLPAVERLEELNAQRRDLEQATYDQALAQIVGMPAEEKEDILVVANLDWHPGIVGIVSARLSERFQLPVICFAGYEGEYRGSARSYGAFNILEAIKACSDHCLSFGGHLFAAGVNLAEEALPAFKQTLFAYCQQTARTGEKRLQLEYDCQLPPSFVTDELAADLTHLEPCGKGNEQPIFLLNDLVIDEWRPVGQGQHISLRLRLADGSLVRAIAFRSADYGDLFRPGDRVTIACKIKWQEWNGNYNLQLLIEDMLVPLTGIRLWDQAEALEKLYSQGKSINDISQEFACSLKALQEDRDQEAALVRYLQSRPNLAGQHLDASLLARAVARQEQVFITPFIVHRIMDKLGAAGQLKLRKSEDFVLCYEWIDKAGQGGKEESNDD